MGFFSTSPKSKSELKAYEREKALASKNYAKEVSRARLDEVKKQARFDALPRSERAKQRLQKGYGFLKTGVEKFKAVDAKLGAEAKSQGAGGGIIQQSLARDRQGPKNEGLIIQSLRGRRR